MKSCITCIKLYKGWISRKRWQCTIHGLLVMMQYFFLPLQDPSVPATPCIVFSGEDVEEADLHIEVDREMLFAVKNGEEGLAAVLSAYWLFNIQYDRKLFITLVVLERLFLGLTLSTPRVVATKFLNKVAKSVPCWMCWSCALLPHHEFSCNFQMHVLFCLTISAIHMKETNSHREQGKLMATLFVFFNLQC